MKKYGNIVLILILILVPDTQFPGHDDVITKIARVVDWGLEWITAQVSGEENRRIQKIGSLAGRR
jgi:hypothetical protein